MTTKMGSVRRNNFHAGLSEKGPNCSAYARPVCEHDQNYIQQYFEDAALVGKIDQKSKQQIVMLGADLCLFVVSLDACEVKRPRSVRARVKIANRAMLTSGFSSRTVTASKPDNAANP